MDCEACNKSIIYEQEILKCTSCSKNYHYACLNITSAYYLNNMFELKKSWRCPSCQNVTKRIKNDNTPVRARFPNLNDTTMSVDDSITEDQYRHEPNTTKNDEITPNLTHTTFDDTSILEKIGLLLDRKLEENKKSILSEIRNTIETRIEIKTDKLRKDITKTTDTLANDQSILRDKINTLNVTIKKLETENKKLQEEMRQIISNKQPNLQNNADNSKKIVLFGLTEYDHEIETQLHHRIVNIFQEILNVDLTGYIEELTRIGRKNSDRRPIVIELLSKKMSKYILQHARFFRNTGLSISDYLDERALQHRKSLQVQLRAARLDGHHAVIRNNKLIIDGNLTHTYLQNQTSSSSQAPQRAVPSQHGSKDSASAPTHRDTQDLPASSHKHNFRH